MRVSKSLEEIRRIKEKISSEIAGKSHEEIIRYFRQKRPPKWGRCLDSKSPDLPLHVQTEIA